MPPFALGFSEFTTMPWSFKRDRAAYVRAGTAAMEVVEAKLDDGRAAEQLASIGAAGLAISGVQPKVRTFFHSR